MAELELLGRETPVDLLTTDAMIPRQNVTPLLKVDPARASVSVGLPTARADEAHREDALTGGVNDCLTKPLAPAVAPPLRWLRQERTQRPGPRPEYQISCGRQSPGAAS